MNLESPNSNRSSYVFKIEFFGMLGTAAFIPVEILSILLHHED